MKVRFYVDVPEIATEQEIKATHFFANTTPLGVPMLGYKRVAFDVDLPIEVVTVHNIQDAKVVQ